MLQLCPPLPPIRTLREQEDSEIAENQPIPRLPWDKSTSKTSTLTHYHDTKIVAVVIDEIRNTIPAQSDIMINIRHQKLTGYIYRLLQTLVITHVEVHRTEGHHNRHYPPMLSNLIKDGERHPIGNGSLIT